MNDSSRIAGLVPIAFGLLFLAVFWVIMFPSVLDFEREWTTGGGIDLGPGPLVPFLGFGVIWSAACIFFIVIGLITVFRGSRSYSPGFTAERPGFRSFSSESGRYSSGPAVKPDRKIYSFTRYHGKGHREEVSPLKKDYCPSCGKPVTKGDQFCAKCGSKI